MECRDASVRNSTWHRRRRSWRRSRWPRPRPHSPSRGARPRQPTGRQVARSCARSRAALWRYRGAGSRPTAAGRRTTRCAGADDWAPRTTRLYRRRRRCHCRRRCPRPAARTSSKPRGPIHNRVHPTMWYWRPMPPRWLLLKAPPPRSPSTTGPTTIVTGSSSSSSSPQLRSPTTEVVQILILKVNAN